MSGEPPAVTMKPQMMSVKDAEEAKRIAEFFDEDGSEQHNEEGFGKLGEVTPNTQQGQLNGRPPRTNNVQDDVNMKGVENGQAFADVMGAGGMTIMKKKAAY